MAGMLERDIEKVLVDTVRTAGGRAYKFTSPGNDGVPDRIVCLPGGKIYFVELKTNTGRLTQLQSMQIKRLRDLGQQVYVTKGISGVCEFLRIAGLYEQSEKVRKRYAV